MPNITLEQIKKLLADCSEADRIEIIRAFRAEYRIHQLERAWNVSAEIVLEALARSSELTKRMFKGIIAEAACKVEVIDKLEGWQDITPPGEHAYDFKLQRGNESVTIQTKLQRKQGGVPLMANRVKYLGGSDLFVVETQKSRRGTHKATGQDTRPYRFGEFDILAVAMEPATGDWSQFRFTVERWLVPRPDHPNLLAIYQPVSLTPNYDWTDSLATCLEWWQSSREKTIRVK